MEMLAGDEFERAVTPVPVFGDHPGRNVDAQRAAALLAPCDELARRRQEWALAAGNAHAGIDLSHGGSRSPETPAATDGGIRSGLPVRKFSCCRERGAQLVEQLAGTCATCSTGVRTPRYCSAG